MSKKNSNPVLKQICHDIKLELDRAEIGISLGEVKLDPEQLGVRSLSDLLEETVASLLRANPEKFGLNRVEHGGWRGYDLKLYEAGRSTPLLVNLKTQKYPIVVDATWLMSFSQLKSLADDLNHLYVLKLGYELKQNQLVVHEIGYAGPVSTLQLLVYDRRSKNIVTYLPKTKEEYALSSEFQGLRFRKDFNGVHAHILNTYFVYA